MGEEGEKPYRLNVGIVVFNSKGEVLTGERIQYPGVFQFPQGGIDEGESPLDGAIRELTEETGLDLNGQEPVAEYPDWLTYEFPEDVPEHLKKYRGQKQKWFFFHKDVDTSRLSLDHHDVEFSAVQWSDLARVAEEIVSFKQPVYRELERFGRSVIHDFLAGKKSG